MGENWWQFIHHETDGGMPPPNFLSITSTSPSELSFSVQGDILLSLHKGTLSYPSIEDPIWTGAISDFLDPIRESLYEATVKRLSKRKWDEDDNDDDYPMRLYNFFLERILYNIRNWRHGGTLLLVPDEYNNSDARLKDRVSLKYTTKYDCAWDCLVRSLVNESRYYDLYFPLADGDRECNTELFNEFDTLVDEKNRINEELQDIALHIAALTKVDGALVMTTRFKVLGFGGEIIAQSRTLDSVTQVIEPRIKRPIESFGTRHRSAFRFCSSLEESAAFIVSSDGGVKAAKRSGPEVLFWPNINRGAMGL